MTLPYKLLAAAGVFALAAIWLPRGVTDQPRFPIVAHAASGTKLQCPARNAAGAGSE